MKIKLFVYSQEYNEEVYPNEIKAHIGNLTNKYIFELKKIKIDAEVTITFTSENLREAKQEEMEFLVEVKNKFDENIIWDTIIKVSNNI